MVVPCLHDLLWYLTHEIHHVWQLVCIRLDALDNMPCAFVGKPPQAKVTLRGRVTGPKVWTSASLGTQPNCFTTGMSAV
eukprot:jgi/Botrbrau1/18095/Bobra.0589s0002.1